MEQVDTSHSRSHVLERDASYSRAPSPAISDVPHGLPYPPFDIAAISRFDLGYWYKGSKIQDLLRKGIPLFNRDLFHEAEPILQQAFKELEKVLGRRHELTLHCLRLIGCCLFKLARHKDAEIILRQAFEIQEKMRGHRHGLTDLTRKIIEYSLSIQDYDKEAESIFQRSQLLHLVGCCLFNLSRYKDAEIILRQALETQEKVLGSSHDLTHVSLKMIGESLRKMGRLNEAETIIQRGLKSNRSRLLRVFNTSF